MAHNLKLLASFTLIAAISFSIPQAIQGMEDLSKSGEQKKSSGMQLKKGVGDTLEAILGTGDDVLLKIGMDLNVFKKPIEEEQLEKGQLEVPIRLFLTDFMSSPTAHPAITLTVKVDCESTRPAYILPNRPSSFDSYAQFTNWLKEGYFSNQTSFTYDFHVDVQKSAPSLAQHLFAVMPGGYRFIGTYAVDNAVIQPDETIPQVTYVSKRGNANETIVTLGGTLSLNKKLYSVDGHQQAFPHPMIDQVVFRKDETKKFYSHKWIAKSEVTAKFTYQEFPTHLLQNWPDAPNGIYSLLKQKPGDLERINHVVCWDGNNGKEIDISDNRIFFMVSETINQSIENPPYLEGIVKDEAGNLYITGYRYPEAKGKEAEGEYRQKLEQEVSLAWRAAKEETTNREAKIDELQKQLETTQQDIEVLRQKNCEAEMVLASERQRVAEERARRNAEEEKKKKSIENEILTLKMHAGQNIEELRKQLEITQKELEVVRIKAYEPKKLTAEEEQEKIKRQETEKKEKQAKVAFWGAGIAQALKHIETLERNNLKYSELLIILEELQRNYTVKGMLDICCKEGPPQMPRTEYEKIAFGENALRHTTLPRELLKEIRQLREELGKWIESFRNQGKRSYNIIEMVYGRAKRWREEDRWSLAHEEEYDDACPPGSYRSGAPRGYQLMTEDGEGIVYLSPQDDQYSKPTGRPAVAPAIVDELTKIIEKRLEMYSTLTQTPHPLWEEFFKA